MSDADLDGPEWIDPAAGHHRDLTALTATVRGELDRGRSQGQRHTTDWVHWQTGTAMLLPRLLPGGARARCS